MPSLWSAVAVSTARGSDAFLASASVIALALLPLPALQAEPGDKDCTKKERDHRRRNCRTFAELASDDGALIGERCHQLCRVDWPATGQHPDQLEIGKGEQYRKRHHHCNDRRQQRVRDVTKTLPSGGAIDGCRFIERRRYGLQTRQQRDRNEWYAAPDVGENDRPACVPRVTKEIDIGGDQPQIAQRPRDDRELAGVDPPERDRRQHRRHDERDKDNCAQDRLERRIFIEQQRQVEANREFDGAGNNRVEQGVEDRQPEDAVIREPLVVFDTDKYAAATDL